jgi:hypothetical protein
MDNRCSTRPSNAPRPKTSEIAKLTASGERLRRLRERGLVQVGGDGGWTATEARMTP